MWLAVSVKEPSVLSNMARGRGEYFIRNILVQSHTYCSCWMLGLWRRSGKNMCLHTFQLKVTTSTSLCFIKPWRVTLVSCHKSATCSTKGRVKSVLMVGKRLMGKTKRKERAMRQEVPTTECPGAHFPP